MRRVAINVYRLRALVVVLLAAAAMAAGLIALVAGPTPAQETTASGEALPDLKMQLQNVRSQWKNNVYNPNTGKYERRRVLLFDSIIKNEGTGVGKFEVFGPAPATDRTDKQVSQRIYDINGNFLRDRLATSTETGTPAIIRWDGDGHDHWHVWDLQDFVLYRLDNGSKSKVGQANKHGFCFFDNYNLATNTTTTSPPPGNYQYDCDADGDEVLMGMSPGWGDLYSASIGNGQYIDVTDLPTGNYVLEATADKPNWFQEQNETNNTVSVQVRITNKKK
jgi:hypothetical protein